MEVTRTRKVRVKRRETDLASNQFLKCSTELCREEKGEGGDRGGLGEKRESQKGREQSSQ